MNPDTSALEPAGKAAILVVDDRADKILVLRTVLEELGQDVVTVSGGQEALKQVLERDFAVILMDVNMPGMDGFETAGLIRARRRSAHTPIIFMTAYSDEMHAGQAYSLGAVDFILTPFAPEVLRAKVRVFVHLHQMTERVRQQSSQLIALAREQTARSAAEDAVRRAAFLAEGGRLLGSTLDASAIARDFARFAVPYLGSLCALVLLDDRRRTTRTEIAWSDPGSPDGRGALSARALLDPALEGAIARALANGLPEVLEGPLGSGHGLAFERLDDASPSNLVEPAASLVQAVHPLGARGRRLGALVIAHAPPQTHFMPAELALGEEVAGRLGIALDNALLYREIRDNDRRKDEFLAMLAHELRSPLAPIRNAIEVLGFAGSEAERWPWARDIIDRQSRHLVRLVDDLLDVSRITSGKIQLKSEAVDVAAVLGAAVETSRPQVDERHHQLTVRAPATPLQVQGDFTRVAQVLANLLNNAAKYTPPGGQITVAASAEGAAAVFRVTDNGMGIPEPMLEGVFELFTQLDDSLDRAQGGLGIGLALVKRLVEAQGGRVEAASAGRNLGSQFTVYLPLAEQPTQSAAPAALTVRAPRHRVLIVEDHADSAQTIETLIALDGHEVRNVRDGPAALELVEKFRPDVLLVDIGLPGMDGFEVARRLRASEVTRMSLIVAVTGYGQDRDRSRAIEAGFDHHLVKPVNVPTLLTLLRGRRATAETA
jgi:CheY-like chemotaxis protein/anti-sigma regulatory factor (Ser/Thr protein kinase)